MNPLSTPQLLKNFKIYYKNSDPNVTTFRALRADYDAKRQTAQVIFKSLNKF